MQAQRPRPPTAPTRAEGRRPNAEGRPLRVLFLGHTSTHHPSMALMPILAAPLARKGIQLTHVATPDEALRPEVLAHYDALMIYANHKTLTAAQEQALVSFVEGGKGLIALHCASAMFTEARALHSAGRRRVQHATAPASSAPRSSRPTIRSCADSRRSPPGTRRTSTSATTPSIARC